MSDESGKPERWGNGDPNAGENRATETVRSIARHDRFRQIETLLAKRHTAAAIVRIMMRRTGLQERQIRYDLAEVYERMQVDDATEHSSRVSRARAAWARRFRRLERQANAEGVKGTAVGAAYERAANEALHQLSKIEGVYAPKKIELTQTVSVSMRITSLVGVLDADGLAALEVVQRQIAAAREKGMLPVADDEDDTSNGKDPDDA